MDLESLVFLYCQDFIKKVFSRFHILYCLSGLQIKSGLRYNGAYYRILFRSCKTKSWLLNLLNALQKYCPSISTTPTWFEIDLSKTLPFAASQTRYKNQYEMQLALHRYLLLKIHCYFLWKILLISLLRAQKKDCLQSRLRILF
jgi:hypothetical protein